VLYIIFSALPILSHIAINYRFTCGKMFSSKAKMVFLLKKKITIQRRMYNFKYNMCLLLKKNKIIKLICNRKVKYLAFKTIMKL
jgi:hypothetical protein